MRLRALLLLPLLTGLSLVAIMAQTPVTLQPGVSGEREAAKKKGIALLLDLREAIAQIKSPHTRINNQLMAANLLRDNDEKAASKYLSDAVAGVKQLLAAANADDDPDESMAQFGMISQLRAAVIQILAETDPDEALSFLRSTAPGYSPWGNPNELANQESAFELLIADHIARKDPARALQLAKQNLKKAYSPSLMNTASQLAEKNPELASELVRDITSKILGEENLISRGEAANLAITLTTYYGVSEKRVELKPNEMNARIPRFQSLHAGLVSEQDFKQLVQKMVREVLSFSPANGNGFSSGDALWTVMSGLRSLGPELDKVVSGSTAALEKKQAELIGNGSNQWGNQFQEYQNLIASNSEDAAMEAIDKAPTDFREQLYLMLATKEAGSGDVNRAKQIINEHISNPYQRRQALRAFDQQELEHAISTGKIAEALRNISAIRTPSQRAEQLIQVTSQIGAGQERATALTLLEQARSLLPLSPQAQDQGQMDALLQIARAFAPYDSKRSFEIVDPLVDQFNDLCTAAHTLSGFGSEYFENDELDVQDDGSLAQIAQQLAGVLGQLSSINFDRAKATADKLRLPEVRVHAQLAIAEQAIAGKQ